MLVEAVVVIHLQIMQVVLAEGVLGLMLEHQLQELQILEAVVAVLRQV
jgi:hypothetical protein